MALNEQQIQALEKKGFNLETMNRYESAIYLLQNLSNTLTLDYDEYMKHFGIRGKASDLANKVKKSTENYLQHIREVIPEKEERNFLLDYERFEADFRKFAGLGELKAE